MAKWKKIKAKTEKITWRKLKAGTILIIHLIIFIHGSALLSLSGPRLHQQRLPQLCPSDVAGGGICSEGLLAAWWSIWETRSCPTVAWTHLHTPAVPREAWGRRVSIHGVGTLRGSLVRVCPAVQRLPFRLQDCLGGTSEFLWLPFGLRKCAVFYQAWHSGIPVALRHQQGRGCRIAGSKTHLEEHNRGKQQGLLHRTEAQRGLALCFSPITARGPGRLRRGLVAALSLCFSQHQTLLFTLLALCDCCPRWTEVGGDTEAWAVCVPATIPSCPLCSVYLCVVPLTLTCVNDEHCSSMQNKSSENSIPDHCFWQFQVRVAHFSI